MRYLLYNPRLKSLGSQIERERILHSLIKREKLGMTEMLDSRFHYFFALRPKTDAMLQVASIIVSLDDVHSLSEQASSARRTTKVHNSKPKSFDLGSVLERVNAYRCSLPWFIVFEMVLGDTCCDSSEWLKVVEGRSEKRIDDQTRILPRYTLTFTLVAGTAPQ